MGNFKKTAPTIKRAEPRPCATIAKDTTRHHYSFDYDYDWPFQNLPLVTYLAASWMCEFTVPEIRTFQVLQELARPEGMTAGQISEYLGMTAGAVERCTDELERKGALIRSPDINMEAIGKAAAWLINPEHEMANPNYMYWQFCDD
jgi:hypothetical protein